MTPPPIPRATYRLQFNADFTFADAEALVPYLDDLGISHVYASSFLAARPGSRHGYDVVDHNRINPEIGDEAGLKRLAAALAARGMGLILDFVPNHMGIGGADNAWWLDVLEWGRESPHAGDFDINWEPARASLRGKILVPFLGDHYGAVLERGELVPRFDRAEGSLSVWYWEHRYPLWPGHYHRLLRAAVALVGEATAAAALEGVLDLARQVGRGRRAGGRATAERRRRAGELKQQLAALAARHPPVAAAIDRALARLAGAAGEPRSFAGLHRLLEAQNYRLAFWKAASDEINYRRFFDINDLAGLRIERLSLFERTHQLAFRLLAEDVIHGLRIDHIDGLYDPALYCRRLQRRAADLVPRPADAGRGQPLYLLVEKILAQHERLRRDWPVAGTTGYEFMNQVTGLFVDRDNAEAMENVHTRFVGARADFDREVYEAKKHIMRHHMASELNVLATELARIAESHWRSRDFTLADLRLAIMEVVACLPIYRTYITGRRVSEQDRLYVEWAVAQARRSGGGDAAVYDFLAEALTTRLVRGRGGFYSRRAVLDFAMRFQQYSGPVMAKGFEDTALYRYNRLLALNEVGGDPRRFGLAPAAFHKANRARLRAYPHAMLATATHDAKRGEDVRARLAALSEMPDEWRQHLARWAQLNAPFRRRLDSGPAPEPDDEVLLYQTLLGAWPAAGGRRAVADLVGRLEVVTVKALREAKRRTSWDAPDGDYETAVLEFLRRITETGRRNPFLDDFAVLQERLARVGMVNGLAQTLLKMTAPGVPDFYQGTELWHLALVDPDNRHAVDYDRRRRLLAELRRGDDDIAALLPHWRDGRVKLDLIRRVLAFRRARPGLFRGGDYQPLPVRGEAAGTICAFARVDGDAAMVVIVPVLVARRWPGNADRPPLGRDWRGLSVDAPRGGHERAWRNVLTGDAVTPVSGRRRGRFAVADALGRFPVALLASEDISP